MSPNGSEAIRAVMPEAEVSLRLAFWLQESGEAEGVVDVGIDGAQVQIAETVHFDLLRFLFDCGRKQYVASSKWQCEWALNVNGRHIRIHSNLGRGDVVARLRSGATLRAECKKGPLTRSRSSAEYKLMREALGQLITIDDVSEGDMLAIAVPHAPKFQELAERWRRAPLIMRFGVRILTVDRTGNVFGFKNGAAI